MTSPALPPQGDTDWYDWATYVDTKARASTQVRVDGSPVATFDVSSAPVTPESIGAVPLLQGGYGELLTSGESTIDRRMVNTASTSLGSSGTLRLNYFRARRTETVNNVRIQGGAVAAAGVTLIRVGIYTEDASGNLTLAASTPNDTTLFGTTFTEYTKAFSAGWTKTANVRYAVGLLVVATTLPQFYGTLASANGGMAGGEMNRSPRLNGALASQSDLPASITNASITSSGVGTIYYALTP